MEQSAPVRRKYTVDEYLLRESKSTLRHEYRDGEIISMAGARNSHVRIVQNLGFQLSGRLRGTDCEARGTDQRIKVDQTRYCYPDQTVVCKPLMFEPPEGDLVLTNPRVIFEVQSESTEFLDRSDKFYRYMGIDSLQEYVLLAQDRPRVETFYRQPDGVWAIGGMVGDLAAVVRLRSLGIELKMSDLYERVEFLPERGASETSDGHSSDRVETPKPTP